MRSNITKKRISLSPNFLSSFTRSIVETFYINWFAAKWNRFLVAQSRLDIMIQVIDEDSYEKDIIFFVELGEPKQIKESERDADSGTGVEFETHNATELSDDERIALLGRPRLGDLVRTQIRIKENKEFKNTVDKLIKKANVSLMVGTSSWKEQFMEAITVSAEHMKTSFRLSVIPKHTPLINMVAGPAQHPSTCKNDSVNILVSALFTLTLPVPLKSHLRVLKFLGCQHKRLSKWFRVYSTRDDEEDDEEGDPKLPSCGDYVMHFLTIFWKVMFAFVPPTDYWGGWLCFVVSILGIGLLTAIIGDMASHFGCTVGLPDSVTAISFVALGTSVPDTFASKVAAINDKYADSSIGNVTGSNAVNVFLGLGIAWSMAAIYHAMDGNQFEVDPGNLAFSVTLFCSMAVLAIIVLMIRRTPQVGGELGGPMKYKIPTTILFGFFWVFYVFMSSLESYGVIKGF
uniref:Sodium/calcium exchanger membrane region domain-containing protein n=1 Tax=Strigamia maritima TaxID=126957 RepID=T1JMV5_STRMM